MEDGHIEQDVSKACGPASISDEQWGSSIRAMHEGERPKPLPHLKSVHVGVHVSVL